MRPAGESCPVAKGLGVGQRARRRRAAGGERKETYRTSRSKNAPHKLLLLDLYCAFPLPPLAFAAHLASDDLDPAREAILDTRQVDQRTEGA